MPVEEDILESPVQTLGLNGELRLIPLAELHESPKNPRRHYPANELQELADSMRRSGFYPWGALTVRPRAEGGYEIGAGHRRRRAAERAGLTEIPCWVAEMDDQQFRDVLTFDNANRDDLHPLDEARGFAAWIEESGKTAKDLAERLGDGKRSWVYDRLKLLDAIPEAQQACYEGKITAGHLVLIARLEPKLQKESLENCTDWRGVPLSVRQFACWIQCAADGADLARAHFDQDDAELVPAAGSCAVCPKRQGTVCFDAKCFDRKTAADVARKSQSGLVAVSGSYSKAPAGMLSSAEYEEIREPDPEDLLDRDPDDDPIESDKCDFAETAVVADGGDAGKTMQICRNPKCPVHGRMLSNRASFGSSRAPEKDYWAKQARALPERIRRQSRQRLLSAVLRSIDRGAQLSHGQLQLAAEALLPFSVPAELMHAFAFPWAKDADKGKNGIALAKDLGDAIRSGKGAPASEFLGRIILGLSLYEAAKDYCSDSTLKRLKKAADLCAIDASKIEADTKKTLTEEFERKRKAAKDIKQKAAAHMAKAAPAEARGSEARRSQSGSGEAARPEPPGKAESSQVGR